MRRTTRGRALGYPTTDMVPVEHRDGQNRFHLQVFPFNTTKRKYSEEFDQKTTSNLAVNSS